MFELDHTALALGILIMAIGLPSGVVLNTIICAKLAKRFFRTGGDRPTIGFVAGAVATIVCMLFIDPIIGWFVSFPVSIALTWLMVRYATMGQIRQGRRGPWEFTPGRFPLRAQERTAALAERPSFRGASSPRPRARRRR